jgi:hypothetical protein
MTCRVLGREEFNRLLATPARAAFRLELQDEYREPVEVDTVARFTAGHPQDPTEVPALRDWYDLIRRLSRAGRHIGRVRVHSDPPTMYQQWERWAGRWNVDAGEVVQYLTRQRAEEIGLLPAAGVADWWLLDDERLILMHFDAEYRRTDELTDDPGLVEQARAWRDLAVQHGVLDTSHGAFSA